MSENTLDRAEFYDEQAFLHNSLGEYKKALNFYKKSLEIKEHFHGEFHEEIAIACRNIAVIYENLIEYKTALKFYERALEISEKIILDDSLEINKLYSYVGNLYGKLENFNKSLEFLQKALEKSIEDFGEHLETAKIYSLLASYYKNTKEFEFALDMEERALLIFKEVLGDEDEFTLTCYESLLKIHINLNENDETLEIIAKLIDTKIKLYGENSTEVYRCLCKIANFYHQAKNYQKALEIYHKISSLENIDKVHIYSSMGFIYQALKNSEKTYEYYMKAFEMIKDAKTEEMAIACNNMAIYFSEHRHYNEAKLFHQKAIEIRTNIYGENHSITALSYNNLAFICSQMQDFDNALKLYYKTLEIRINTLGEFHDDTIMSLSNISYVYSEIKNYNKALEFYEKILQIHFKKHGEHHKKTANSFLNIGISCYNLKNNAKAMEFYEKSLEITEKLKDISLKNDIVHYIKLIDDENLI